MPKISIIVPVYKVEPYLRRCVDSILNQTYKDYEIILIDDGSPDNCGNICDEYAELYDFIRVIHKENGGLSDARNSGVSIAKGEWGIFIDSDDVIHPQLLEFAIKTAEDTNSNIVLCGRYQSENIPKCFFSKKQISYRIFEINENQLIELFFNQDDCLSDLYWVVVPKLTKLSILKRHPFTKGRIFEDNAVAYKMLIEAKKAAVVNKDLYFYMVNQEGIMKSKFSSKTLDYLWALEQQIEYYHNIEYNRIMKLVIEEYFHNTVSFGKQFINELHDESSCKKLMQETEDKLRKYSKYCEFTLDIHTKNFIMKYAHPVRFKVKKKIRNIKAYLNLE